MGLPRRFSEAHEFAAHYYAQHDMILFRVYCVVLPAQVGRGRCWYGDSCGGVSGQGWAESGPVGYCGLWVVWYGGGEVARRFSIGGCTCKGNLGCMGNKAGVGLGRDGEKLCGSRVRHGRSVVGQGEM